MSHLAKAVRMLWSQCAPTLERPHTRSVKYGDRAFSAVAPAFWNGLPTHIRCAKTLYTFKKLLKTYFFRQAFDESYIVQCATPYGKMSSWIWRYTNLVSLFYLLIYVCFITKYWYLDIFTIFPIFNTMWLLSHTPVAASNCWLVKLH